MILRLRIAMLKKYKDVTHHCDKHGAQLCEPDESRRVDDPDVDEDVGKVEEDEGAEETEAKPRVVKVNWKRKRTQSSQKI